MVADLAEKWVKELKDKKQIKAIKVDTKYNIADLHTKCLTAVTRQVLEDIIVAKTFPSKYAWISSFSIFGNSRCAAMKLAPFER